MGIKLGGSCQCCGCFVQLDSDTAVGSIFLYDRPMPTANEWTAYFPNFINDIIFGADASGVGGYLVQVSSTATDAFGTSYDIVVTLTDRTEDSVVATKEFLTFSSGVGPLILHKETCEGGPYSEEVAVYVGVGSGDDTPLLTPREVWLRCFAASASGTHWGSTVSQESLGHGYGYRDPLLLDATLDGSGVRTDPYCNLCGVISQTFDGGSATTCTGGTLRVIVSNLPAELTVASGISGTTTYTGQDAANGTYLLTPSCSMCVYNNDVFTLEFETNGNSFFDRFQLQALLDFPDPVDLTDPQFVTCLEPEPYFLERFFTDNFDAVTTDPTRYYRTGACSWLKPGNTSGTDRVPREHMQIEVEWLP